MIFFIHVNYNLERTNGIFVGFEKKHYVQSFTYSNSHRVAIFSKLQYVVNEQEYFVDVSKAYFELKQVHNTIPIYYYRFFPALGSISNHNLKIAVLFLLAILFGYFGWKQDASQIKLKAKKNC